MDLVASFSLAASILRVVQFSLSVLQQSKNRYQNSASSLQDIATVDLIIRDLKRRVDVMQASAAFDEQFADTSLTTLCTACLETSEELIKILTKLKFNTKGKAWTSLKQALFAMGQKERIEGLVQQLENIRQEIEFILTLTTSDHIFNQTKAIRDMGSKIQKLLDQVESRPKEIGYPWETGITQDRVKIDDGLGPEYFLPISWCATPEAFFDSLNYRYKSGNYPGLKQVQRGHIQLWEWNERHVITEQTWESVVNSDRALKVAFVMGSFRGPPRRRCMRCFKPRDSKHFRSLFQNCHSCKLAVKWVAPDAFPFEPTDIAIWDQNSYRDYRVAQFRPRKSSRSEVSSVSSTTAATTEATAKKPKDGEIPSIDLVCHRLIMKWEPIYNVVHRYVFCRCILRLSTPSRLVDELTLLQAAECPRHNTERITFRDYSELAQNCHKDPYFERFGGYNAFWALLHVYHPRIYDDLGGEAAISRNQLESGLSDLRQMSDQSIDKVVGILIDYYFEVTETLVGAGLVLPPDRAEGFEKEKARRAAREGKNSGLPLSPSVSNCHFGDMSDWPMMKEVKAIIDGKWNGTPHWIIED